MAHPNLSHRRTHNLLLISKLLNQRDNISPVTLILDSLEQPSSPLLREYLRRSKLARTNTIFLSYETAQPPRNVTHFVRCWDKSPAQSLQEVKRILVPTHTSTVATPAAQRFLILIDSLHAIVSHASQHLTFNLPAYLSSFILADPQKSKVQLSLIGVYHTDIAYQATNEYAPSSLAQLSYLATSVIKLHSVAHLLAEKAARDRSIAAPVFGLAEELEGVLVGFNRKSKTLGPGTCGLAIELEHRRKSGRAVLEWFFLPSQVPKQSSMRDHFREHITLLDDHPLFHQQLDVTNAPEDLSGLTFDLGLTERQRQERQGVVLPYFDAQKAGGGGEGGRILYNIGAEDDFDDEEDED